MKSILLHICCGICSSSAIEKLKQDGFKISGLFYNPNIHPEEEYLRRLETARTVAGILKIKLIEGVYDQKNWLAEVKGLENEAEGGRRCAICFRMRLEYSAKMAKKRGLNYFTTTLTISPHKNTNWINEIGRAVGQDYFLEYDFKKKEGFKNAIDFARRHQLYRQNYCGCIFSQMKTRLTEQSERKPEAEFDPSLRYRVVSLRSNSSEGFNSQDALDIKDVKGYNLRRFAP
jgi:hypothetical protein